jgi:hypothetical protein
LDPPTRERRRPLVALAPAIFEGVFDDVALVQLHDQALKDGLRSFGVKAESLDELTG